jgi:ATP-dependent protease ClpP protease subunit
MTFSHAIIYSGPTNLPQSQSLRSQLAFLNQPQQNTTGLLLVLSSWGGNTFEARSLYGLLRAVSYPIDIHAVGVIKSSAVPLFLAADRRTAAPDVEFMFHGWTWSLDQHPGQPIEELQQTAMQLSHEVKWARGVLQERAKLTSVDIDSLQLFEKPRIEGVDFALRYGLIDQAIDLKIPVGIMTWNIVGG